MSSHHRRVIQQSRDILTPHPHDVLCGRGAGILKHAGNLRFRELVKNKQQEYLQLKKQQKIFLTQSIVFAVRNLSPPGRFLHRDGMGRWNEIGDQKANEKTAQSLREGAPKLKKVLEAKSQKRNHTAHQTHQTHQRGVFDSDYFSYYNAGASQIPALSTPPPICATPFQQSHQALPPASNISPCWYTEDRAILIDHKQEGWSSAYRCAPTHRQEIFHLVDESDSEPLNPQIGATCLDIQDICHLQNCLGLNQPQNEQNMNPL